MEAASSLALVAKRLQGKVALITGGASGIGESTAKLFARHGANIIIADIQSELGNSVSKQIESETGQSVTYVHCNVTRESDIENAVDRAVSKHGKLDIMFNNAGISGSLDPRILSVDIEDVKRVFDVNVYGGILGAKHAARVMIPQKRGCILFTSSLAGVKYGDVPYGYSGSKHAVIGLAKNLAVELGQYGIRVNCISPAGTPTPLFMNAFGVGADKIQEWASALASLKGVMLDANDIAEAALYLASDDSKFVTGLNLLVDGGSSLMSVPHSHINPQD